MSEHSIDERLIQRLRETAPENLSQEDVDAIRRRLPHSPELQSLLAEDLRLEAALNERLASFQVSIETILERAEKHEGRTGRLRLLGWMFVVLLLASGVGAGVWMLNRPDPAGPVVVEGDPEPDKPDPADTDPEPRPDVDPLDPPELNPSPQPMPEPEPQPAPMPEPEPEVELPPLRRPDSLYETFRTEQAAVEADLREWLQPVDERGKGSRIIQERNRAGFDGLVRLKPEWRSGGALQLGVFDSQNLEFIVYHGDEAAVFRRLGDERWVAYEATRSKKLSEPDWTRLVGSDSFRYRRSYPGPVELRYADGWLSLTRGDLRLVSVPLAGEPDEVYLNGRGWIRNIELVDPIPLPEPVEPLRPIVFKTDAPAEHDWQADLAGGGEVNASAAGPMILSLAPPTEDKDRWRDSWIGLPLDRAGLYTVDFRVGHADPGTGVFLGNKDGKPYYRVAFLREEASNKTVFSPLWPDERRDTTRQDGNNQPVTLAGEETWIRLVACCGSLQVFTSANGKDWSPVHNPLRVVQGPYLSFGVFCMPGDKPRRIELLGVEVRELSLLADLAPPEIRSRALAFPLMNTLGDWHGAMLASRPADVDLDAWRRAVAYATIAAHPDAKLQQSLLFALTDEAAADSARPIEWRRAALAEMTLLADAWDAGGCEQVVERFTRFGRQLIREGHTRPWTVMSEALMAVNVFSHHGRFDLFPLPIIRQEVIQAAIEGRAADLAAVIDRILFFSTGSRNEWDQRGDSENLYDLLAWGQSVAERQIENYKPAVPLERSLAWRHPLVETLSKEGYNILAEFKAALEGESFRDACQIIAASSAEGALGLLPEGSDPALLVSLPGAVSIAMRSNAQLRQTMRNEMGPIGQLRVRRAIASRDPVALQAATVQFYGTEAAAEAHLWLGDRALSAGDSAEAVSQYNQAMSHGSGGLDRELELRRRLAAALLGRDVGKPADGPVAFGELTLSAEEFENLAHALRSERSGTTSRVQGMSGSMYAESGSLAPPAVVYELEKEADFSGSSGRGGGKNRSSKHDWAGRQSAMAIAGELLLVHNRFELRAFDRESGDLKWRASTGNQEGMVHAWSTVAMRPLVAGDRVYVRRLTQSGPELVAVRLADGEVLWRQQPGLGVASDPFLVQNELFALCLAGGIGNMVHVELVHFDPQSGHVQSRRRLVQFRDVWEQSLPCEAVVDGTRIVVSAGGTVFCCTPDGRPQWLRRHTWLPADQDSLSGEQAYSQPIVDGGRIVTTQPGVRTVESIDVATGRLQWQYIDEGLIRTLGVTDEVALIEVRGAIVGLDAGSGQQLWRHELPGEGLEAYLVGGEHGLLVSSATEVSENRQSPILSWLDPKTGELRGRQTLTSLYSRKPMFGPMIWDGTSLWGQWASSFEGDNAARRELYRLKPTELPLASVSGDMNRAVLHYATDLAQNAMPTVAMATPGWVLLESANERMFIPNGNRDQPAQPQLHLRANRERDATLVRPVTLASEEAATLRLTADLSDSRHVRVLVSWNGETLETFGPLDADTAHWEKELTLPSGRVGENCLEVRFRVLSNTAASVFWEDLEVKVAGK